MRLTFLGAVAAVLVICGMPLWFAHDGLRVYFTGDDAMNLHYYWTKPWRDLLIANLAYYSPFYRPMGGLFYRSLFAIFGFHPFPFRVACFGIMLCNLGLFYVVGSLLSGSRGTGLLTALIGCYHGKFEELYYNTGTVYDLLCFTFYMGAFALYVRIRQAGRRLRWFEAALVLALYICALNAKEMAVTLPLAILVYEWIYHRSEFSKTRFAWLLLVMVAPYLYGKLSSASSFANNADYQMHISARRYFEFYHHYIEIMFYRNWGWLTWPRAVVLWTALVGIAALLRRKAMWFSLLFILFSVLPVIFVTVRGTIFVLYIPFLGWSLYAATLLSALSRRTYVTFAIAAVALFAIHQRPHRDLAAEQLMRSFTEQLHAALPTIPPNSRILLLDDPFPKDEWAPVFLTQLSYGDSTIQLDRVKTMEHPPDAGQIKGYTAAIVIRVIRGQATKPLN